MPAHSCQDVLVDRDSSCTSTIPQSSGRPNVRFCESIMLTYPLTLYLEDRDHPDSQFISCNAEERTRRQTTRKKSNSIDIMMTPSTGTTSTFDPSESFQPLPLSDAFRYINLYTDKACPQVLVVELARPRKRNALNARLWKEIGLVFHEIGTHNKSLAAIRSVLLIGQGKGFCGGIDVTDISFFPATPGVRSLRSDNDDDEKSHDDVAHVGLQFLPLLRQMRLQLIFAPKKITNRKHYLVTLFLFFLLPK